MLSFDSPLSRLLCRRDWLVWALLVARPPGGWAQAKSLRISNGDWAPFMGENLPHHGFVSRIVTEAFRLEGVAVQYEFYPWARAYHVARNGGVDASIGWYRTEEREQEFLFSDAVFVESQVLFYRKDKPVRWTTLEDLRGLSIGATLGYTYGEKFKELEESKALDVQRTGSDEQNLRKLLADRVQVVVLSRAVGTRLLQSLGGELQQRIVFDPRPVNSGPLHVIFPKASPHSAAWLALFNRGLRALKATGAAERMSLEN